MGAKKGQVSNAKGKHWKIKDTSNMGHPAWNKGLKLPELSIKMKGKSQRGTGWKHSKATRNKIAQSSIIKYDRIGRKCKRVRCRKYMLWRESVFTRDNYKCVLCGKGGNIQADHIKKWADYPKLRYKLSNGRTLCIPCHKATDNYGNKGKLKLN